MATKTLSESYKWTIGSRSGTYTEKYIWTYTTSSTGSKYTITLTKFQASVTGLPSDWGTTVLGRTLVLKVGSGSSIYLESYKDIGPSNYGKTLTLWTGSKSATITKSKTATQDIYMLNNTAAWNYDSRKFVTVPKRTSYTVSYNANGGSGAPSAQTKWADETLTLSSTKPTRTNYIFKGWATSSGGSVAYASGANYTANSAVTLYAVWQATYAVNYNANGGSGAPSAQTKRHGETLTLSSTKPTRTGYNFKGWATSSGGSVAYASGANYTANAAVTLYAVWELITYTVSYNANSGSGAPTNQTKQYGITLKLSSIIPTKNGYNFKGWATSSGGSVAYASGANYTANAAVTLYAVWEQYYFPPSISNLTASRAIYDSETSKYDEDDNGTIAHVKFNWNVGTDGSSSIYPTHCYIGIKEESASNYEETEIILDHSLNYANTYIDDSNLDPDIEYNVRVRFTLDNWSDTNAYTYIGRAWYVMDVNEELTAIGFGMSAPDGQTGIFSSMPIAVNHSAGFLNTNDVDGTDTGMRTTRTDKGTSALFGIGVGGENHGVYSSVLGKWLIRGDTADVYINQDVNMSNQTANKVLASPNGSTGKPNFRALVAADIPPLGAGKITSGTFADARIPNLNASKITSGTLPIARGGTNSTSASGARSSLGASGAISIQTKDISFTVAGNGYKGDSIALTLSNYDGRCVVGWNVSGDGTSNTIPIKCYYNQTENKIHWGIKNVGSTSITGTLKVFVLFTYKG